MAKRKAIRRKTPRRIRPTGLSGWQRSTKAQRTKVPSHVFLDQRGRRYPVKTYRGGKWVLSPRMEMAAYKRAAQQGERTIRNKAKRLVNQRRRKTGKPLVGGAKR